MAVFKIAVKYAGRSSEDILEIEASTVSDAKRVCDGLARENAELLERLRRFNVYASRIIESCRLCPYDPRLGLLKCDEIIGSLKSEDDV